MSGISALTASLRRIETGGPEARSALEILQTTARAGRGGTGETSKGGGLRAGWREEGGGTRRVAGTWQYVAGTWVKRARALFEGEQRKRRSMRRSDAI